MIPDPKKADPVKAALAEAAADRDRARAATQSACGELADMASTVLERLRKRAPKVHLVKVAKR